MKKIARGLAGLVVFLAIGEVIGRSGITSQQYLPPSSAVLAEFGSLLGNVPFLRDVLATLLSWAISLGIATGIAVPLGLLLGTVPALRAATAIVVEFVRPIPSVALIPLVVLLMGTGPSTKITLAAFAAVWPIMFNTIYAVREQDPLLLETARAFGTGSWSTALRVRLPSAAPFVLTGIRVASAIVFITIISVELLASAAGGLGTFIEQAASAGDQMDVVLAGTATAGILAYLLNAVLEHLQGRYFGWAVTEEPA